MKLSKNIFLLLAITIAVIVMGIGYSAINSVKRCINFHSYDTSRRYNMKVCM